MNDLKILIVEDEPLIADDIAYYLSKAGFNNTVTVDNYSDAIRELNSQSIDFAFLDLTLNSELSGIDLAKEINHHYLIPFVFITSHADKSTVNEIKVLHPVGYIVKPFNGKDIPAVLELGLELFYTFIETKNAFDFSKLNKFVTTELTPQEKNVILKLIEGKRNQQLADELFVSINTIKTHLKNIFLKLEVTSRAEAMVLLSKCK
jgi:DNA-binding NarL/FixJ family response regulator